MTFDFALFQRPPRQKYMDGLGITVSLLIGESSAELQLIY